MLSSVLIFVKVISITKIWVYMYETSVMWYTFLSSTNKIDKQRQTDEEFYEQQVQ